MSDIIKLNVKSKRMNVTLHNQSGGDQIKLESSEDFLQSQFLQHYEEGFDEGRKSATILLEQEFSDKINKKNNEMAKIISEFDLMVNEYSQSFEKLVVNLSFIIAERIVKREISQNPIIDSVLSDSIKRVLGSNKILIKLNPGD
ncbi:MAG TPA: FliH/SctL family protein, partial [Ignavibacteriaceae bacterium]|nr:FliH/SctL family protein [Ignavibacteriaceae bacterium]